MSPETSSPWRQRIIVPEADATDQLLARQWSAPASASRSETERDRDRILYSSAFKRLAHVTQVTASETGLIFHSRLTHSLKVAQFARRLAERLQRANGLTGAAARAVEHLDADATEAAALAHDIGHPPFGHLAETELDRLAKGFGGFEGNAQSFRILTNLALRAEDHIGLNLTRVTLNGVLKYPWLRDEENDAHSKKWNAYPVDRPAFDWVRTGHPGPERSLEAEIMDWADDVTYAVHDMDDFYRAGLVPLDRLCGGGQELDAFQRYLQESPHGLPTDELCASAEQVFGHLMAFDVPYSGTRSERINLRATGSSLITRYIEAFTVENTAETGAEIAIPPSLRNEVDVLKQLIWCYVIQRPALAILQRGQRKVVTELFRIYEKAALASELRMFPALYAERLKRSPTEDSKRRAVVDLISSMTEAGATEVYRRITGITVASVSDPTGRLA
jgi:dGTPase